MKLKVLFTSLIILTVSSVALPQERITVEEYIGLYSDLAVEEMKQYRIPASITLAQGILESECGNSPLAREANNHFGIKCHKEWTGKTFFQDDDEANECFRKYQKPEESYADHSFFLSSRDRYKFLFDLDIKDYKAWAYGLKQAGYATNPRYPELLIKIIEENGLEEYDKVGGQQSAVSSQQSAVSGQQSAVSSQRSGPPEVFEMSGKGHNDRIIFLNNGVKFVLAREGDDFYKIADDFGIYSWQIREYNEFSKQDSLVAGQKIYLEKKKNKSKIEFHLVKPGDNLQSVSQDYGIRMKSLSRLNNKMPDEELSEGERLRLK